MSLKLTRICDEPIMTGNEANDWEKASCYNAGAIKKDGIVHLFYRATDTNSNGRENNKFKSCIGHAVSKDGINFTRDKEYVLGPRPDSQYIRGCEDPRVVCIGGRYYMLYTGYGGRFGGDYRICMASSDDLDTWQEHGVMLDESNKDAALFPEKIDGEYVLLHRRAPNIWVSYSNDLKTWGKHKILAEIDEDSEWENCKIGIAGPPLKLQNGYALIYHGVSEKETDFEGRGAYRQYALGIMLLDDKANLVYRQKEPILIPELDWELGGYVPNVVFSCGQVLMSDELFVYYAGADTALGVAKCSIKDIEELFTLVG